MKINFKPDVKILDFEFGAGAHKRQLTPGKGPFEVTINEWYDIRASEYFIVLPDVEPETAEVKEN